MAVLYIANMRFPTEKAHGKQVREVCNALSSLTQVTLVVPTRKTEGTLAQFGLSEKVRVVRVPVPDLVRMGRIGFLITAGFFALGSGIYALFHPRSAVITREYSCALLPALFGMRTAWESHRGEWNWMVRAALAFGARIIVISEGLRALYLSKGVAAQKIFVAPDGVDLSRYRNLPSKAEARQKLDLPAEASIAIYNGHLHTWKGAGTLARAATYLPQGFLLICMGGTDEDIEAFTQEYADDPRIKIIGRKSDKERPLYLRAADAAVLPNTAGDVISTSYTSPLKLFGYMAAGVPIAASDLPSIREVVSEKTAFFAKADDPESFAKTLMHIVGNPGEAAERAKAAHVLVKDYEWVTRSKRILAFLEGTLQG